MLTSTVRRRELGASLSALVVPKPVTVASEPGCGKDVSAEGRQEKSCKKKEPQNRQNVVQNPITVVSKTGCGKDVYGGGKREKKVAKIWLLKKNGSQSEKKK